jgi:hypothetical protein
VPHILHKRELVLAKHMLVDKPRVAQALGRQLLDCRRGKVVWVCGARGQEVGRAGESWQEQRGARGACAALRQGWRSGWEGL